MRASTFAGTPSQIVSSGKICSSPLGTRAFFDNLFVSRGDGARSEERGSEDAIPPTAASVGEKLLGSKFEFTFQRNQDLARPSYKGTTAPRTAVARGCITLQQALPHPAVSNIAVIAASLFACLFVPIDRYRRRAPPRPTDRRDAP